jgi:putative tricarboxylic transport membrane protein
MGETAVHRPWWLGLAVVTLGGVWLYNGLSSGRAHTISGVGPGLAVTLIGGALVILGVLFLIQLGRGLSVESEAGETIEAQPRDRRMAALIAFVATAAPLLLIEHVGFPLTAAVVFAGVARAFGSRRLVVDVAIGLVLGSVSWAGFQLLGLNLGSFFPLLASA